MEEAAGGARRREADAVREQSGARGSDGGERQLSSQMMQRIRDLEVQQKTPPRAQSLHAKHDALLDRPKQKKERCDAAADAQSATLAVPEAEQQALDADGEKTMRGMEVQNEKIRLFDEALRGREMELAELVDKHAAFTTKVDAAAEQVNSRTVA